MRYISNGGRKAKIETRRTNITIVIVYKPKPAEKPKKTQFQRATDVVKPLIWLRDEKTIELTLSIAAAMTVAQERSGSPVSHSSIKTKSSNALDVDVKEIRIKVLRPAECLLLDLSQPKAKDKTKDKHSLKIIESVLTPHDQEPRMFAIGSFCINRIKEFI